MRAMRGFHLQPLHCQNYERCIACKHRVQVDNARQPSTHPHYHCARQECAPVFFVTLFSLEPSMEMSTPSCRARRYCSSAAHGFRHMMTAIISSGVMPRYELVMDELDLLQLSNAGTLWHFCCPRALPCRFTGLVMVRTWTSPACGAPVTRL